MDNQLQDSMQQPSAPIIPNPSQSLMDRTIEPSSPRKSFIIPILVILLVAMTALASYFYYNLSLLKQIGNPLPSDIGLMPEPIPSPTIDPTAGWQTYTNQNYDFTFKYPIDWKVTASPTTGDQLNIVIDKKTNTSEAGFIPFQMSINMTQDLDGNNFTSVNEAKNNFIKSFDTSSVNVNNITFHDKPGVAITGVMAGPGPGAGQFLSYTLVQLDKKVLVIQLGQKSYQSSFDQILSTFEFTN